MSGIDEEQMPLTLLPFFEPVEAKTLKELARLGRAAPQPRHGFAPLHRLIDVWAG